MNTLSHIVVALDDSQNLGSSLEKAAKLEHYTGARISVVETFWDPISEEPTQHFSWEEIEGVASRIRETELRSLEAAVSDYSEQCAELQTHVLWSKHHEEAVAEFALANGADLIISPRHAKGILASMRLLSEVKLAANSTTPLLLSSARIWPDNVHVLVALDITDKQHRELNDRLGEAGRTLSRTLGGELHLVTVSPEFNESVDFVESPEEFCRRAEENRRAGLHAFAETHPGVYAGLHVKTGSVVNVLDELASAYGIGIVVVGTAARTGLRRLFVGNTAESMIKQLDNLDIVMVPTPTDS